MAFKNTHDFGGANLDWLPRNQESTVWDYNTPAGTGKQRMTIEFQHITLRNILTVITPRFLKKGKNKPHPIYQTIKAFKQFNNLNPH